jgi:hypothetical protein
MALSALYYVSQPLDDHAQRSGKRDRTAMALKRDTDRALVLAAAPGIYLWSAHMMAHHIAISGRTAPWKQEILNGVFRSLNLIDDDIIVPETLAALLPFWVIEARSEVARKFLERGWPYSSARYMSKLLDVALVDRRPEMRQRDEALVSMLEPLAFDIFETALVHAQNLHMCEKCFDAYTGWHVIHIVDLLVRWQDFSLRAYVDHLGAVIRFPAFITLDIPRSARMWSQSEEHMPVLKQTVKISISLLRVMFSQDTPIHHAIPKAIEERLPQILFRASLWLTADNEFGPLRDPEDCSVETSEDVTFLLGYVLIGHLFLRPVIELAYQYADAYAQWTEVHSLVKPVGCGALPTLWHGLLHKWRPLYLPKPETGNKCGYSKVSQ